MKKFFKEFGAFISKGNALDLAVGLVLGTAFNAIIKSLVNDIIMPLLGFLIKGDMRNLYVVLRGSATYDATLGQLVLSENAVLLTYGNFFQAVIDFLIIAVAIFLTLKIIMNFRSRLDAIKNKIVESEPEKVQQ